jgi:hypothetical protein
MLIAPNEANAEEDFINQMTDTFVNNLPTMIANAFLGNSEPISLNTTIHKINLDKYQYSEESEPSLSVMINNALLGNVYRSSFNSTSLDQVKQQFITINPDLNNENLIFEKPDKHVQQLITTEVPFILPVPFP